MARVPHIVRKHKKSKIMGKPAVITQQDIAAMQVDIRLELIRSLIPLGLAHVAAELEQEVASLAGVRHSRKADQDAPRRHGTMTRQASDTLPKKEASSSNPSLFLISFCWTVMANPFQF